ncbi:MAG: hypothetical protein ABII00_01325 [Elusimicrobiota bacterium]
MDGNVSLLIAAGEAVAANSESVLKESLRDLLEAGVAEAHIRAAIDVGQTVKGKPAAILKEAADVLTGTDLAEKKARGCPLDDAEPDADLRVPMLVAAGAAMAANCEPCLNQVVPMLIEAGVEESDIRSAVEAGQCVKDRAAGIVKEAADALTGAGPAREAGAKRRPAGCGAC